MKRITITLALAIAVASTTLAQLPGVNGTGFFENRSAQSDEWLHEATDGHPWVLRIPGGAIAKFANPAPGKPGWGLDHKGIDSIQMKYGSPEEEDQTNAITKWHRKSDQQPDYSYLDDVWAFCEAFPETKVIWVANIYIPTDQAMIPIEYLESKVNLIAVELGNESYSQVDYDTSAYKRLADRLIPEIKALGLPVSHPAANVGNRAKPEQTKWNDFLNRNYPTDWITKHEYFDGREIPALTRPVDQNAAIEGINAYDFQARFQLVRDAFPRAAGIMVTEFNSQPADLIGNTPANAVLVDRAFKAGLQVYDIFCIHNGVAADKYGIIFGDPPVQNTTWEPWTKYVQKGTDGECDTVITPAQYDTTWTSVWIQPTDPKCGKFWFNLFNRRKCKPQEIKIPTITQISPPDTTINCSDNPPTGCANPGGTDPGEIQCRSGSDDDYLHQERFIDPDGNCVCDECGVVWDHRINTKFWGTIRNAVHDSTNIWINPEDPIDMKVTLLETGETITRYDIFHYCTPDGRPTWFNTNTEVWNEWKIFLQANMDRKNTWTFGIELTHRPSGIHINEYWNDQTTDLPHDKVTLRFTGLNQ